MDRKTIEALKSYVKFLEEESNRELEASSDFMDGVKAGYIDALDEFKRVLDENECVLPTEYAEITGEWEEGAEIRG